MVKLSCEKVKDKDEFLDCFVARTPGNFSICILPDASSPKCRNKIFLFYYARDGNTYRVRETCGGLSFFMTKTVMDGSHI